LSFFILKIHLNASTFLFLSSFEKMSRVKNLKNRTLNFGLNKVFYFEKKVKNKENKPHLRSA